MIHDLTANSDFTSSSRLRLNFRLPDRSDEPRPEDELVFTGDALERESKRFYVDYNADKTICDCCGGYIDKIPWHWNDTNKTICNICEKILSKENIAEMFEDAQEVIGTLQSGEFQLSKPWTMKEERENAVDNVLLWD